MAIEKIAPVERPQPVAPLQPAPSLPPPSPLAEPTLVPTRRATAAEPPNEELDSRPNRQLIDRAGTRIVGMVIDLDAARIALISPEGPPVRGDVSTDLAPGCYQLKVDRAKQQWVFEPGQVSSGLRFYVRLDGTKPFSLVYADSFLLVAGRGFLPDGFESFAKVKQRLLEHVHDRIFVDAFAALDGLNDVGLYDMVEELWATDPGVVNELLLQFERVLKADQFDMTRILRALENYAVAAEKLYIDSFDKCVVDPSSFARDAEREKVGKWNIKLVFTYDLMPARGIVVYADDIVDADTKSQDKPTFGEGGLLYPALCSKGSTPRMWAAKQQKIAEIEAGNLEFIKTSYTAVETVISLVFAANSLMVRTLPAAGGTLRSPRPISEAKSKQPGQWMPDFEGGTNMSKEAEVYQSRVCKADPGWGYRVNGVQFDGFESGTLIDAKYYVDKGGMSRSLMRNSWWAGNKALDQAARQLRAAGGTPVEWRVAGQAAAGKLTELFRVNKVAIRVVYIP